MVIQLVKIILEYNFCFQHYRKHSLIKSRDVDIFNLKDYMNTQIEYTKKDAMFMTIH